jgi:hypothetical protein
MPRTSPDPLSQIPDPDTVRRTLAETVRRTELLRRLLRLARRKAELATDPTPTPSLPEGATRGQ